MFQGMQSEFVMNEAINTLFMFHRQDLFGNTAIRLTSMRQPSVSVPAEIVICQRGKDHARLSQSYLCRVEQFKRW